MGLIACVAMAFGGRYIYLFFVLGQLSREIHHDPSQCDVSVKYADVNFRVKLATMKYIGEYLCSTCIIMKNQVKGIGT